MNLASKINRNIYYKYAGIWFFFTFIVMCIYIDSESFPLLNFILIIICIIAITSLALLIKVLSINKIKLDNEVISIYKFNKKNEKHFYLKDTKELKWNFDSRIKSVAQDVIYNNFQVSDNTFFIVHFTNEVSLKVKKKNYNNYAELVHFFLSYCKNHSLPIHKA